MQEDRDERVENKPELETTTTDTEDRKDQTVLESSTADSDLEVDQEKSSPRSEEKEESTIDLAQQLRLAQDTIEKMREEVKDAKDQVLRAHAEVQNVQRRARQDVEKAHKYALEKMVESLLPVIDSLERGLASSTAEEVQDKTTIEEGIQLTLKLFADTLQKFNIEAVNPEGEPFDPKLHQAMSQVDNPNVESGSVTEVFQKGYTLHGRLVRPAMVIVAK